ncbi:MAG: ABC transporter permease [Clostridia bacterium]|jgi:ABC-2 type transport system permease protein|nr:ABC transporter permease [Clostridia bacterium]NLV33376.1 ABC transporter permease [Clostridiaceae bacterium]MDD4502222.1 ABC transporter permease [Clostridia bacterium]HPB16769.1 ABC transporter permease [Clostridia bacterium]HQM97303.1 ABC transporter permease [Clostridia bacterium]
MSAVAKKEIAGYFKSPIAYVLIGVYLLIMSIYFHPALKAGYGDFVDVLDDVGIFLIFIIPILTMRILAEDKKNGTEVLLLTSPTSLPKIVIGKFLATFTVFLVIVGISFVYPFIVVIFEGVITTQLVGAYVGFILLGAAFCSVGVFCSSLTENQIIAAIISLVIMFSMWIADQYAATVGGLLGGIMEWMSVLSRYGVFTQGLLSLENIIFFLSFTALMLYMTIRVIERRRWIQG